jgi:hypothetical protein
VHVIALLLSVVLIVVAGGTAVADLLHNASRVATLQRLGLRRGTEAQVGIIKLLAVAGLLVGRGAGPLTVGASWFLVAYFLVAAVMHRRVKDSWRVIRVPLALALVALLCAVTA